MRLVHLSQWLSAPQGVMSWGSSVCFARDQGRCVPCLPVFSNMRCDAIVLVFTLSTTVSMCTAQSQAQVAILVSDV